jgi:acyl carrier protein
MTDVRNNAIAIFRRLAALKTDNINGSTDEELLSMNVADLGFDSLERMELVMELENTFGVSLDEEEFFECANLADVLKLIERSV